MQFYWTSNAEIKERDPKSKIDKVIMMHNIMQAKKKQATFKVNKKTLVEKQAQGIPLKPSKNKKYARQIVKLRVNNLSNESKLSTVNTAVLTPNAEGGEDTYPSSLSLVPKSDDEQKMQKAEYEAMLKQLPSIHVFEDEEEAENAKEAVQNYISERYLHTHDSQNTPLR